MGWGTGNLDGGSGGGLNFKVVGNPRPSNPKENTIWVNTDNKITGYYFQAKQPVEMAEGEVWISTGTSSQVAFNALKKGTVMVYPISAKQYVSGACVDVTAQSYQGGEWVDWWNGELYTPGNTYAGWSYVPMAIGNYYPNVGEPEVANGAQSMTITQKTYITGCAYVYNDEIDLSRYSTLTFDGEFYSSVSHLEYSSCLCIWTELGTYADDYLVAYLNFNTVGDKKIDVSEMVGKYRIGVYVFSTNSYVRVNSLRLE